MPASHSTSDRAAKAGNTPSARSTVFSASSAVFWQSEAIVASSENDWTPDPEYLALWREKLRALIRQFKEKKLATRLDTSDLVQDALLQVVQQVGAFRGTTPAEFDAWLKSIARGHAMNASRFHHAKKRDIAAESPSVSPVSNEQERPDEILARQESYRQMLTAIDQLEQRERYVVLQHIFEKKTYVDIASELECSPSFVSYIFQQALSHIRSFLGGDQQDS